jgi:hypothetical protein
MLRCTSGSETWPALLRHARVSSDAVVLSDWFIDSKSNAHLAKALDSKAVVRFWSISPAASAKGIRMIKLARIDSGGRAFLFTGAVIRLV